MANEAKKEEVKEEVKEQETCACHSENDDIPHCCGGCCHEQAEISKEEELTKEVNRLLEENKTLSEKIKYSQAELINYRKRKDEETQGLLKYANQDLILEIIQVVDNFERALKLEDKDLSEEVSKFLSGFKMMYASLNETLKKFGVEEISRVGQPFDHTQEQALLTDCVEDQENEIVLEVLLKGYKLKDRVIRPASVKINQK